MTLTIGKNKQINTPASYLDVGKGEPVLLLHGLFGNLSNWENVVNELQANFRVLIPRLPLFDVSITETKLDSLVFFLEKFIESHRFSNVTLIGNSLGGHLGLLYTLRNPEKVKKIVLTGSSGLYENTLGNSFFRVKDYEFVREKISYTFYKKEVVTKALVDDVYETIQSRGKTLSIISIARAAQKQNLAEVLGQIQTPTLLVWGLQDEITPPEVAIEFHNKLPNATLKFIDECGHVPMMEQPQLFNQYLTEFLSQ